MQKRASLQKMRLRKNAFGDKTGFADLHYLDDRLKQGWITSKTHLRRRRKSLQSRIHRPHDGVNTSTDRGLAHDAAQRRVGRRPTVRDGAEELPRLVRVREEQPTVDLVRERRRPPRRLNHSLPGAAAPRLEVRVDGSRDRGGARPLAMCQRQQRLKVRG